MTGHRFVDLRTIRERMERKDQRIRREDQARLAQRETRVEQPSDDVTDFEMAEAMQAFGGTFVAILGRLWQHGDADNRAKILATWPELVAEYRELARLKRAQAKV